MMKINKTKPGSILILKKSRLFSNLDYGSCAVDCYEGDLFTNLSVNFNPDDSVEQTEDGKINTFKRYEFLVRDTVVYSWITDKLFDDLFQTL